MRQEETNLQIRCVTYLTYKYSHLLWHHSPNEGKRSDLQGAKLKKMGMQTGWPDLDIIDGNKTVHVEFKTSTGRQSREQKNIQKRIEEQGHIYCLCRSYDEFTEICHIHFGPESDPDAERLKQILQIV